MEDSGFQNLLSVLDPKYTPSSHRLFMRNHLPALYESKTKELKQTLPNIKYCSITSDLWTSRSTMGFLTVTWHYIVDWCLQSAVLETIHIDEAHTINNLGCELKT